MRKTGFISAIVTAVLIGALAGGCQEGQETSAGSTSSPQDVKMHRLIAAENSQLKAENENLRGQTEQLKQQLAKSEEERKMWQDKAEREIKENVEGIMKIQLEENIKLTTEIEQLQAEVAKLKGESASEPQAIPEQPKENEEPNTVEPKGEEKPEMPQ